MFRLFNRKRFNRESWRAARAEGGVHYAGRFFPWDQLQRHILFLGGVGSGKTFASNDLIRAIMASGCPMVCNTVQPNDCERLMGLAREAGQLHRTRRITPHSHGHNLIDSLLAPDDSPARAAQFLLRIGKVGKQATGDGRDGGEFWVTQSERAIAAAITLCRAVLGRAAIPDVHAVIMTTPGSLVEYQTKPEWDPEKEANDDGAEVRRRRCAELISLAHRRGVQERPEVHNAILYLTGELGGGGDRMRGGVIAECNNTLGRFIDRPWIEALSGKTTIGGRIIEEEGLIAVLDHATLVYGVPAAMWQFAIMLDVDRHCLRRHRDSVRLPMVKVREECGHALNPEWDAKVCIVSRGQKLAHIDVVQDVSTLLMAIGGKEAEAYAFVANHAGATFCFGSRDMKTCKWMSELIGQRPEILISGGGQQPTGDWCDDLLGVGGHHWSQTFRPAFPPEKFSRLKVGQAIMIAGDTWQPVDFWKGGPR